MSLKLFKDVLVYQLTDDRFCAELDLAAFNHALGRKLSRMPAPTELGTFGFVPPCGDEELLVEAFGDHLLVKAQIWKRDLPGAVVKRELQAKVQKIERDEERKVYAKERNRLKEEIILNLLPRAFIKGKTVTALIGLDRIMIDTASAKVAEELLSLIREVLGRLPVRPLMLKHSPVATMTAILRTGDTYEDVFQLGDRFVLNGAHEEDSTISGNRVDVDDDEIRALLDKGRQVTRLGFNWLSDHDTVSVTVCDDLSLRGIAWGQELEDIALDQLGESEDLITCQRVTYRLVADELDRLVTEVIDLLGGLQHDSNSSERASIDFEASLEKALKNVTKITRVVQLPAEEAEGEDLI